MENQQPIENVNPSHKRRDLILIFIFLVLIILVGLVGYNYTNIYNRIISYNTGNKPSITPSSKNPDITETASVTPTPATDVFYYISYDSNNIYSHNIKSNTDINITNYNTNSFSLSDIQVADNYTLAYIRCDHDENKNCSLMVYDLSQSTSNAINNLEYANISNIRYDAINYVNAKNYAYLVSKDNKDGSTEDILYAVIGGKEKTLFDNKNSEPAGGRDGSIADKVEIRFSPDLKNIYVINTGSMVHNSFDFTTYIYNVNTGEKAQIQNSTRPRWIDNNTIVFTRYSRTQSSKDSGLYTYNLSKEKETLLPNTNQNDFIMSTIPLSDKFLYVKVDYNTEGPSDSIYEYDLSNNTTKLVISKANEPTFLNENQFIYYKELPCTNQEECGLNDYKASNVMIYNLDTGKSIETNMDNPYGAVRIATYYDNNTY